MVPYIDSKHYTFPVGCRGKIRIEAGYQAVYFNAINDYSLSKLPALTIEGGRIVFNIQIL